MKYRIVEMMNGDFHVEYYNKTLEKWLINLDIPFVYGVKRYHSFKSYNEAKKCLDKIQEFANDYKDSVILRIHDEVEVDEHDEYLDN